MKKLFAMFLATSIIGSMSMTVSASGCSDWDTLSVGEAYCDSSDGCGFLWQQATNKAETILVRTCIDDAGNQHTQLDSTTVTLGCCNE